ISVIRFFRLEAGMSTMRWPAICAFRILVKKSAIGSVTIIISIVNCKFFVQRQPHSEAMKSYQLAFFRPGILPFRAMSRRAILEMPKYLTYPLGRPDIWQRLCRRTFEEFFGSSSRAAQLPAFLSSSLLAAYLATIFSLFLCLADTDVFAIIAY